MPRVALPFVGHMNSGERILARISRTAWLLDTLHQGTIRFAPASSYHDTSLSAARTDDEMSKSYNRPGQQVTVTGPGGPIPVLGDMIFSSRREIERGGTFKPVPYWLSCFSTELDPRLFCEFPSVDPTEDGCLVIFDVDAFLRRALPALGPFAAAKRLIQNNYFDPYHPPPAGVNAIEAKAVGYAYQREARFVLDPEGGPPLAGGGPFFLSIGSIEDIAAVYGRDGAKTAGTGPVTFLA